MPLDCQMCVHVMGRKASYRHYRSTSSWSQLPLEIRLYWWNSLASGEHISVAHLWNFDHFFKSTVTPVLCLACQECAQVFGSKDSYSHNRLSSSCCQLPWKTAFKAQISLLNCLRNYLPRPVEKGLQASAWLWTSDNTSWFLRKWTSISNQTPKHKVYTPAKTLEYLTTNIARRELPQKLPRSITPLRFRDSHVDQEAGKKYRWITFPDSACM